MYNYTLNVKTLCDEWVKQNKEFSAFDVTKELRVRCNRSVFPTTVYHSLVRGEVHSYMTNYADYSQKNSDNGAYLVYYPLPVVNVQNKLSPTFGSFPSNSTGLGVSKKNQFKSVVLNKGKNGKFTVPAELVNTTTGFTTVKFMLGEKVVENKVYRLDKNNVRFRLPVVVDVRQTVNVVKVQQTSNPSIILVKV